VAQIYDPLGFGREFCHGLYLKLRGKWGKEREIEGDL